MTHVLVLYIVDANAPHFGWAIVGRESGCLIEAGHVEAGGTLKPQADAVDETRIILGGETIFFGATSLSGIPRKDQANAALYAFEERLGADPETLHVALGDQPEDKDAGLVPVCLVDKDVLATALATARKLGLNPATAVPDFLVAQPQPGVITHIELGERSLVSEGLRGGFSSDHIFAHQIIETLLSNSGDVPPKVLHEIWERPHLFEEAVREEPLVNLMKGRFRPRMELARFAVEWRRAAMLAAACLLLYVGTLVAGWLSLSKEAEATRQEAENRFREAFPEVGRIVNLEAQMRQKLQSAGTSSGSEFLDLSSALMAGVESVASARLESLQYDGSRRGLSATVEYGSFEDVDLLKVKLSEAGLSVEEGSARQEGARIVGELTIGGRR